MNTVFNVSNPDEFPLPTRFRKSRAEMKPVCNPNINLINLTLTRLLLRTCPLVKLNKNTATDLQRYILSYGSCLHMCVVRPGPRHAGLETRHSRFRYTSNWSCKYGVNGLIVVIDRMSRHRKSTYAFVCVLMLVFLPFCIFASGCMQVSAARRTFLPRLIVAQNGLPFDPQIGLRVFAETFNVSLPSSYPFIDLDIFKTPARWH